MQPGRRSNTQAAGGKIPHFRLESPIFSVSPLEEEPIVGSSMFQDKIRLMASQSDVFQPFAVLRARQDSSHDIIRLMRSIVIVWCSWSLLPEPLSGITTEAGIHSRRGAEAST
jgi:hypothetical protein